MLEWIIGAAVVAAAGYFVYKMMKGSSVNVSTLDVNNDGKINKNDAGAAVANIAEKTKENVAEVADKAASKVKKKVNKAADKVVKKTGRPKKNS
jgi:DNA-directed RNA polymerase